MQKEDFMSLADLKRQREKEPLQEKKHWGKTQGK